MQNEIIKIMALTLSICLAPSPVMAIGLSTIICDNNSADWVGFRKKSTLFFKPNYEMRPKKNLWIELTSGDTDGVRERDGRDWTGHLWRERG